MSKKKEKGLPECYSCIRIPVAPPSFAFKNKKDSKKYKFKMEDY